MRGNSSWVENRRALPYSARVLAVIAVICGSSAALAQSAEPPSHALFFEGRRLVSEGKYEQACPKFEEAQRLSPGIGILFNLADCLEHLGKSASAWKLFVDVTTMARSAGQPERERVARERAARLEPTLSRLTLRIPEQPEIEVLQNGTPLDAAHWGTAIPVDPGEQRIVVTAPGMKTHETTVDVPGGGIRVNLVLPPLEPERPSKLEPQRDAPTHASSSKPRSGPSRPSSRTVAARKLPRRPHGDSQAESAPFERSAGFVLGGVAAAAVTTGVVFGLIASHKNQQASDLCRPYNPELGIHECDSREQVRRHDALVDEAGLARSFSITGFTAGGAALVGSALLLWRAHFAARPPRAAAVVMPSMTGDGVGLRVESRF